ncbi:MAG: protease [Bryobacterales bacterium]|nr:protease [Bryobacterales bacterium]
MPNLLEDMKIAILATDGFEQVELLEPRKALNAEGARTTVVSPKSGKIKGWNFTDWGQEVAVEESLDSVTAEDFDALLLPGGVINPDKLRVIPKAVQFVQEFIGATKPVASICHGPWMLVEAGAVAGRTVTSWPSLRTDIRNAGGNWVDEEVILDNGVVTSRKPEDIPAFNRVMIGMFADALRAKQAPRTRTA